jgi:hypothetical protein
VRKFLGEWGNQELRKLFEAEFRGGECSVDERLGVDDPQISAEAGAKFS